MIGSVGSVDGTCDQRPSCLRRSLLYFLAFPLAGMALLGGPTAIGSVGSVDGSCDQRPSCLRRSLLCFLAFPLAGMALLGGPTEHFFFYCGPKPLSANLCRYHNCLRHGRRKKTKTDISYGWFTIEQACIMTTKGNDAYRIERTESLLK